MLPADWKFTNGYLVGPHANLMGANLAGADLAGADLTAVNLAEVQSGGITGTPQALPQDWQLIDGFLFGPSADLTGANPNRQGPKQCELVCCNPYECDSHEYKSGLWPDRCGLSMVKVWRNSGCADQCRYVSNLLMVT